jgi:transcriptional regulator with XRE-family HTH domain
MISIEQIKAARTMLGWSAVELARRSGVGTATVKRYELQSGIPSATTKILSAIKQTLESEGIEFTGDPLANPGVTLHVNRRSDHLPQS